MTPECNLEQGEKNLMKKKVGQLVMSQKRKVPGSTGGLNAAYSLTF